MTKTSGQILHKLLFKILQVLHHLGNLTSPHIKLPKAFQKKQDEWTRFIRPAQDFPGSKFQQKFPSLVNTFLENTKTIMIEHYLDQLHKLPFQIYPLHAKTNAAQLDTAVHTALSWARKNFGKKLKRETINSFAELVEKYKTIISQPKNQTQNQTNGNQPKNQTQNQTNGNQPKNQTQNQTNGNQPKNQSSRQPQNPNNSPKPSTSYAEQTRPRWNPNRQPKNVKGKKDPLSNFFPCKMLFRGEWFRSAEQAYQFTKATFLNAEDVATKIKGSSDAYAAKDLSKQLKTNPNFAKWTNTQTSVMREILAIKFNFVAIFRNTLLGTTGVRLIHDVPDAFWGTYSKNQLGKKLPGKDMFSRLLMELRESKTPCGNNTHPSPPSPPSPNTSPFSTPKRQGKASFVAGSESPILTQNPFLPLFTHDDFPPITPQSPPSTTFTTPYLPPKPQRPPKQPRTRHTQPTHTKSVGPRLTVHKGDKNKWAAPQFQSKVAILGDSNLSRISETPQEVESIQIDSFPGAKLLHLTHIINTQTTNKQAPDTLILNIGINNRDNKPQTHRFNLRNLAKSASHRFPNTKIYIPQVNYSDRLPEAQKQSLSAFNSIATAIAEASDNISTIPKLNNSDFVTTPDTIHWTAETANKMLAHWNNSLN